MLARCSVKGLGSIAILCEIVFVVHGGRAPAARSSAVVGIWYESWYTKAGNYNWATGFSDLSHKQFLADVDGDGRADAISFDPATGAWLVALSTGSAFAPPVVWFQRGHGVGSVNQFVADVNGDGKADAVIFLPNGDWWVALSTGNAFATPIDWFPGGGHGVGSARQFVADVNGDHKADAIIYIAQTGDWWVALSTGKGFAAPKDWFPGGGHGVGSANQFVADVDGDGLADAIVYLPNGDWWVARSTASACRPGSTGLNQRCRFGTPSDWTPGPPPGGFGFGSSRQFVADIDGDGRADAIVYQESAGCYGCWYRALSKPDGTFHIVDKNSPWKATHGNLFFLGHAATWAGLSDVNGDKKAEPVAFFGTGRWTVLPDPYHQPAILNRWDSYDIQYLPITNGHPVTYSSSDPSVIDEHLHLIASAGITFLIFDLTNGLRTDNIYQSSLAVCQQMSNFNVMNGTHLNYAVAMGGIQGDHNPATSEAEAADVETTFLNNPAFRGCAQDYFQWNGKPLLVFYSNYTDRQKWEAFGPKTATSRFSILFASGNVPDDFLQGTNPSATGRGCGVVPASSAPPAAQFGRYVGWSMPFGALGSSGPATVLMPGHNPHNGTRDFVSRTQNVSGVTKTFYTLCGWDRVLSAPPQLVVITSFNDYMEETAVAPTDTSQVGRADHRGIGSEQWPNPSYYWDVTKAKIAQLQK